MLAFYNGMALEFAHSNLRTRICADGEVVVATDVREMFLKVLEHS